MPRDILIAFVGKPSAGKSSFLNAVSDAAAKVGNFPFTTIKPNHGVAYVTVDCPCKRFGKESQCAPKHGKCDMGKRYVPIKMLDVAGLVPGASSGEGLGNQFLDDLRTADMLIHIVDVSGTTDAAGKVTQGYDPINDIDWLRSEIHSWIFGNLMKRWGGIVRRHVALKSPIAETFQGQLSGYGANLAVCQRTIDRSGIKEPLEKWEESTVSSFVDAFLDERFPTVIALNKIDLPDSDKNIEKICRKYDSSRIVLTSAASENFLRRLHKQGFIKYYEGTDQFDLAEHQEPDDPNPLKPLPPGILPKLEKLQDLVLFRYGTTGIQATLKLCVSTLGLIPTYPVRNINNYGDGIMGKAGVFRDCLLVRKGSKVRDVMEWVLGDAAKFCMYAETVGSIRLSEDDLITEENSILSFKMSNETRE
ncbi:P-loop containing nucleoside triphosphate hydrolase protein [Chytridium lagenaria]|nr:P-loop containing nucleoside triphosphate hydrolase protein [Chytridium lagenaria]